jgi:hypothetical protein
MTAFAEPYLGLNDCRTARHPCRAFRGFPLLDHRHWAALYPQQPGGNTNASRQPACTLCCDELTALRERRCRRCRMRNIDHSQHVVLTPVASARSSLRPPMSSPVATIRSTPSSETCAANSEEPWWFHAGTTIARDGPALRLFARSPAGPGLSWADARRRATRCHR